MHPFASLLSSRRPLLLLAPLASLSHRAMRELIHSHGACDLYFTEMISSDALIARSTYKEWYLDAAPCPERTVFQLVGSETDHILAAARILQNRFNDAESASSTPAWAGIDLNMGCSAPEMVRKGMGVHWMSQPDVARALVAAIRPLVPANRSLSVKMRIGESEDFEALLAFCRGLEAEGVDFLTLHPRLRGDPWGRPARWSWFGRLARELKVPLIANGDIKNSASLQELGKSWNGSSNDSAWPAGIMLGRAAIRAPWIFSRLRAELNGDTATGHGPWDLLQNAERFHELLEQYQPSDFWITRAKRFYAFFCASMPYGNRIASIIQNLESYHLILPRFQAYVAEHPEERWHHED